MDTFIGIRFKKETAIRFQEFSKLHFRSHTEAMAAMLDFFLDNNISPKEKFGPVGSTMEANLKKRMNAIIAIIRDIEKNQTKPTVAMLESLFQIEGSQNKPLVLERKYREEKSNIGLADNKNSSNKL